MSTADYKVISPRTHEQKITEIYRRQPGSWRTPITIVMPDGRITQFTPPRVSPRSPPSRSPSVSHIQLGNRPRDYNHGGRGHPPVIEGELTRPPVDGPNQWRLGQRAAWALSQLARKTRRAPGLGQLVGVGLDLYDLWELINQYRKNPSPMVWSGIGSDGAWLCGGPFGATDVFKSGWVDPVTGYKPCGLKLQAGGGINTGTKPFSLEFMQLTHPHPNPLNRRYTVKGVWCSPKGVAQPANRPLPTLGPAVAPFVPLLTAPLPYWATPSRSHEVKPALQPFKGWNGPPLSPRVGTKFRDAPPPPRTHERKGQVAAAIGKAVQVAFAVTEGVDVVDALFDALPASIRKNAPKSGVARKGAYIGEGTRYSTPLDKALTVFKHYRQMDLSEAVKNLLINHFVDKIIGTMSAQGADKLRKQLGASGWGNII